MYNCGKQPDADQRHLQQQLVQLHGGGMSNLASSNPQVRNSILWGNTAPNGAQIYNDEQHTRGHLQRCKVATRVRATSALTRCSVHSAITAAAPGLSRSCPGPPPSTPAMPPTAPSVMTSAA